MKTYVTHSFPHHRRVLTATVVAFIAGALSAAAQSSNASSTAPTSGSTYKQPAANSSATATDRGQSATNPTTGAATGAATGSYNASAGTSGTSATTTPGSNRDANAMTTRADKLNWGDRRFITKTADAGHSEVALAQLAAQRANSQEVRTFAQKIVTDHTKVNSELMTLASSKSVKLDQDDAKDRSYRRLSDETGAEFDRDFLEHMVESHEDSVERFEEAAKDVDDQEVRSFASKHLATLREHLRQAQSLRQSTLPTGRIDSGATTMPRSSATPAGGASSGSLNTGSTSTSTTSPSTDATGNNRGSNSGASPTDTTTPRTSTP